MQTKNEPVETLWERFAAHRDTETKNKLVVHYLPLVKSVVLRMMPAQHMHNHYDDLISCGVLGLMNAIERYDITREVKFDTYAYMRIRGEIIDNLRKQDWAPSNLRRQITQISRAMDEIEMQSGSTASDEDIASFLSMDVGTVGQIMEKAHAFNMLYFEDMLSENYADDDALQDLDSSPTMQLEKEELKTELAGLIEKLPRNERLVITLYYFEELPFRDIAQVMGVSVSRISQIHSKVLMKIKTMLQRYYQ